MKCNALHCKNCKHPEWTHTPAKCEAIHQKVTKITQKLNSLTIKTVFLGNCNCKGYKA